jgi:molybdopterin converting factor small subunit
MATASEIRVRILQLGRQVIDHRAKAGQTVGAALGATGIEVGAGMDLRVNGVAADGETPLRDGDVVTIIPRIKGG